jgi:Fe-S cluster biosynthesis and repair protein YggX
MNTIYCKKLEKDLPPMAFAPYPGDLGARILDNISQEGWDLWLTHQTMLINEYRLNLTDKKSRDFLKAEMIKFLFEGGCDKPAGFTEE